jgi:hypothetical protein
MKQRRQTNLLAGRLGLSRDLIGCGDWARWRHSRSDWTEHFGPTKEANTRQARLWPGCGCKDKIRTNSTSNLGSDLNLWPTVPLPSTCTQNKVHPQPGLQSPLPQFSREILGLSPSGSVTTSPSSRIALALAFALASVFKRRPSRSRV